MPGIHFVRSENIGALGQEYASTLLKLQHDQRYQSEIVYQDDLFWLGICRYPEYPVFVFEDERFFFLLEGRLHSPSGGSINDDLSVLAQHIFESDDLTQIRNWLLDHDGDFVILIRRKATNRWAFLNDALGRLPIYFCRNGNRSYLSRELRFITAQAEPPVFDRMAIAQHLLFGYPLGHRTLLKGTQRLAPATLIQWDKQDVEPRQQIVHHFNFEQKQFQLTDSEAADKLASIFVAACGKQTESGKPIVLSLSGGLDSRAVAAGLQRTNRQFQAVTYQDAGATVTDDAAYARAVAKTLGFPWQLIQLPVPTGREVEHLLRIKGGMNFTAMAFCITYLNELKTRCGDGIIYFSGDGGDKLLPDLRPARRTRSFPELVRLIVDIHHLLPLKLVSELVSIPSEEIIAELQRLVETYPEQTTDQKYVHFMIYERARKWLFEGEDRTRFFFWASTPFYSLPFFRQAMETPDLLKTHGRLFRHFMMRLSSDAANIPEANSGLPLGSAAYEHRRRLVSAIGHYPQFSRLLKSTLHPPATYRTASPTMQCLHEQLHNCRAIDNYLDRPVIEWLSQHPGEFGRTAVDNLFTITSIIEDFSDSELSLRHFRQSLFV